MKFSYLIALAAILATSTSWSQPTAPTAEDPFLNENVIAIQKLHDQSADGDKEATDLLISTLESLIKYDPQNQLYHVYLGSAFTLKSRDVFPGPSKLRYLKEGLKGMDAAVKKDPKNCSVRFIRAINNYYLPSFINRRDNAREDFEILLRQIETDPGNLNSRTLQAIHYFAGLAFKQTNRDEEARQTWQKGLLLNSDEGLNQKIKAEIEKL